MHVVLYQPEIPPNTGAVGRLCAATQTPLHLIQPLGFQIDDKHLKRAGLDYWPYVDLRVHATWQSFRDGCGRARLLYFSKKAPRSYTTINFAADDFLVFGPETRGLPQTMLEENRERTYRIPIMATGVRSLNLANAVAIVLYEGLRQMGQV